MNGSSALNILFFDGFCNLCNSAVAFVLKRDTAESLRYASLDSEAAHMYLAEVDAYKQQSSLVLVQNGKIYTQSSAVLRVAALLPGLWPLLRFFFIVPRPLRDWLYSIVAKNRYKWFGKKDSCYRPEKPVSHLFLK